MTMKRNILQLAIHAGEVLLQNGAEIFRVQDTMERILRAYGIRDFSLYVVSNGLFATLDEEQEDGCSALRHVPVSAIHLGRIAAVNELSRLIEKHPDPTLIKEYRARLETCAAAPHFPLWMRSLSSGVGSGAFCFLFQGRVADCAAAFLCGVLLQIFLSLYGKEGRSRFMHTLLGAAMVSSLAFGMTALLPGLSLDYTVIGAIMPLVPGVALTTSIRDFFNGHYLSGVIHLIEATLTGACIAVGVGAALQFWQFASGEVRL